MLIYREPLLRKQILTIAGPAMGEMIMYMIIGVVDIAVVGRLGASPLAAVSLGAEIFFSLVLFLEALAIGANVLVAQAKGAGNYHQIRSYIAHTIVIAVVLGFVLQAGGLYYTQDILGLFAVEPSVSQQAYDYLYITFQIAPFALLMYMTNAIFRGLGRTDISLIIAVIVNIVNVVGDILLVFGLAGFPKMGVAGAAAATAAAHVVGCGLALAALLFGFSGVRPGWQNFIQLKLRYFKDILTLGIPSLIEQFFYLTSNLLSIYLLVFLGTISFAVHQLAVTVESVSYMPGFGIAIAATTLVGQSIGAQDSKSAAKFAQGCIELSLVIMGSFALIFALAPSWISGMFTNDPDIIPLAEIIIRIAALEQLTIAFTTVASGILKGSGNTRTPMLISTVFTWFFRLPLMYIMIKIFAVPLLYLWILFIFDWFLRSLVYLRLYKRKNWLRPALVKGDSTAD